MIVAVPSAPTARQEIEDAIETALERLEYRVVPLGEGARALASAIRRATTGGKRFRPLLVAAAYDTLDGDGVEELVTGKRIYAHEVEPGATQGSVVLSFRYDREAKRWQKRVLYEGTPASNAPAKAEDRDALADFPRGTVGTGLTLQAIDIDKDGDLDLVCPGKTGLYVLENPRRK